MNQSIPIIRKDNKCETSKNIQETPGKPRRFML